MWDNIYKMQQEIVDTGASLPSQNILRGKPNNNYQIKFLINDRNNLLRIGDSFTDEGEEIKDIVLAYFPNAIYDKTGGETSHDLNYYLPK